MCLLGGCGNEIAHKYSNFKSLCEDSGGSAVDASVCQCGTEKCSKGVICISGKCANTLCNTVGKTRCANDEAGKGWLSVCSGTLTWCKEEPCKMDGADISCRDDEKCGECKDGSFRCDTGQNGQNAKILVCFITTYVTRLLFYLIPIPCGLYAIHYYENQVLRSGGDEPKAGP